MTRLNLITLASTLLLGCTRPAVEVDPTPRDPGRPYAPDSRAYGAGSDQVCAELGKMECDYSCFPDPEMWVACRLEFQVRCSPSVDGAANGSNYAPGQESWERLWSACERAYDTQSCDDGDDLTVPGACRDLLFEYVPARGSH